MMTTKALPMTQHVRNQLSILAWLFAAVCAWALFMAAAAAAAHNTPDRHAVVLSATHCAAPGAQIK